MYRIEYLLKDDGEGFHISTYDTARPPTPETALPISLFPGIFRCGDKKESSITGAIKLGDTASLNSHFRTHITSILKGQDVSWRLVDLNFTEAGSITLSYYHPETDTDQEIDISINDIDMSCLEFRLKVPHANRRPPTEYYISMNHSSKAGSDTIIEVFMPDCRKLFMFVSSEPGTISVTEYADL